MPESSLHSIATFGSAFLASTVSAAHRDLQLNLMNRIAANIRMNRYGLLCVWEALKLEAAT
jgi:hypothetical protein